MRLETIAVRTEGPVVFADISAPPMNLLGPELVRDLVSLIQQVDADPVAQVLVFRSAVDHVVGPASMKVLLDGLPKGQVTVRECADSHHVATLDNDAEAIFEGSVKFVQDHTGEPSG